MANLLMILIGAIFLVVGIPIGITGTAVSLPFDWNVGVVIIGALLSFFGGVFIYFGLE